MESLLADIPTVEQKVAHLQFVGGAVKCDTALGQIEVPSSESYDAAVEALLARFVAWPDRTVTRVAEESEPTRSKLNVQLRTWFRKSKVFSNKTADIANGKVVSGYPVDAEDDLFADFALKNGAIHIIETLDLRGVEKVTRASQGQVGLKAILFDQAKRRLTPESRCIAVTAADEYTKMKAAVRLLSRYAHDAYAVESAEDRQRLAQFISQSLHVDANFPSL
jgi:hypothetical protein